METGNKENVICKYCRSENVIKFGKYKDNQYYYCKDCKRKFADEDTIPKMQYPTSQVSDVLITIVFIWLLHSLIKGYIQWQHILKTGTRIER